MNRSPRAFRPFALLLAVLLIAAACGGDRRGPPRPAGLPATAFWLGGADGGVWLTLLAKPADSGRRVLARVFHEDGTPWYQGPLVLTPDTARPADIADHALLSGWDGEALILKDGRAYTVPRP